MVGEQIEERRLFSYEERKELLKENYGICACCGKKLTTKTMTVEHIIPLRRGGTNAKENLTILCYNCNQLKGNLLYLPAGFYSALRTKPKFEQMQKYLIDWYQTVKDDFDIERYPMIGPRFYIQCEVPGKYKVNRRMPFIKQLTFEYRLINKDYYEEIEAITGLNLRLMRQELHDNIVCPEDQPIAFYSVRKLIDDKILAVFAVNYVKGNDFVAVNVPWHCLPKSYFKGVVLTFIQNLVYTLSTVAGNRIENVCLISPYNECRDAAISFYYSTKAAEVSGSAFLKKGSNEPFYVYNIRLLDEKRFARAMYRKEYAKSKKGIINANT